jgi:mono/diheme cytochrome c family protein
MNRIRPHRTIVLLAVAAAALAAFVSCSQRQPETASTTPAPTMTPMERGKYLVTIAGCNDCHTPGFLFGAPDFERTLAGSEMGWSGPWGVSYPSNLTPDVETGIGAWSDADIERVLRSGIKRDGSPVAPPMPWPEFAHFTPEDLAAVIVYLRSLPPVRHKNLSRVPPGQKATGSIITLPAPSAWDAPKPPAKK